LQTRNLYKSMLGPHEYTIDHSEKSTVETYGTVDTLDRIR